MQPTISEVHFPVGYQTIVWGREIKDLDPVLDLLKACSFEGVEIAQRPDRIGVGSFEELHAKFLQRDLTLLGLAGGTLSDRMKFLETSREPYLYIDEWPGNEAIHTALEEGFHLAVHPLAFKDYDRLEAAFKVLYDHPGLWWMPDTAHLAIAGEKPERAVRRFTDRLVALHLKDWTHVFGRSSQRCSRGFTRLGEGDINLDRVLEEFRRQVWTRRSPGLCAIPWIIVEQDFSDDIESDVVANAKWLHGRGLIATPPALLHRERVLPKAHDETAILTCEKRLGFMHALWAAAKRDGDEFYVAAAKAFAEAGGAKGVALWAHSPASHVLSLVASHPGDMNVPEDLRQDLATDRITRHAIAGQEITAGSITGDRWRTVGEAPTFATSAMDQFVRPLGLDRLVAVPIFNHFNPHTVTFVAELAYSGQDAMPSPGVLQGAARHFSEVADFWLTDRCLAKASRASSSVENTTNAEEFCERLAKCLVRLLHSEGCSVFLVDQNAPNRLDFVKTATAFEWDVTVPQEERYYKRGEGMTGHVWKTAKPIIGADLSRHPKRVGKSKEVVQHQAKDYCLITPLMDQHGFVHGVIRVRNKVLASGEAGHFVEDDLAIAEAVFQAVLPDLISVREADRRARSLVKLTHELRRPVVGLRGALSSLQVAIKTGARPQDLQQSNDIGDALSWSELIVRLLQSTELYGREALVPSFAQVNLGREILEPVLRQAGISLRDHKMSRDNIQVVGFSNLLLYLDVNMMRQVFFNLIDNAIKYGSRTQNPKVEIVAEKRKTRYYFRFRDWGPGIPFDWKKHIFSDGTRAPNVVELGIPGQGVGLNLVQAILESHHGRIGVTSLADPTEFTVTLPATLERQTSF